MWLIVPQINYTVKFNKSQHLYKIYSSQKIEDKCREMSMQDTLPACKYDTKSHQIEFNN